MRAAQDFAAPTADRSALTRVTCELFGSLALTGKGHATDTAILLGLSGETPERIDPSLIPALASEIKDQGRPRLGGRFAIPFSFEEDLVFRRGEFLPGHANAMRFSAMACDAPIEVAVYYSIGGGAIVREGEPPPTLNAAVAHPFTSGEELLEIGRKTGLAFGEIVERNELAWRSIDATRAFLDEVREAMMCCIDEGCRRDGILPGGLKVRRRARDLHTGLLSRGPRSIHQSSSSG